MLEVDFDGGDVEALLSRLDVLLSPAALAEFFLGGMVEPYLLSRIENRFEEEGDDVTGGWAPLREATQAIRASQGFGAAHPINRRTGEMLQFLMHGAKNTPTAYGASLQIPDREPMGELFDKIQTAQMGKERTVPRPVLGMNLTDLSVVMMELEKYLAKGSKGWLVP